MTAVSRVTVSTVGTSTLTNANRAESTWLREHANATALDDAGTSRLQKMEEAGRAAMAANPVAASAELAGLAALDAAHPVERQHHILVHSDTVLGRSTAALVEAKLRADGASAELLTASGLRTDDLLSFQGAMDALTEDLTARLDDYRRQRYAIVFNLTGGFKSVNGYLQAVGMLVADLCVYTFEGSNALVEIPRLPVSWNHDEHFKRHEAIFRRLAVGLPVEAAATSALPESLVMRVGHAAALTMWGQALYSEFRGRVDPTPDLAIDPCIQIADSFKRGANKEPAHAADVARALDALAAHLSVRRPLPASHKLKPLQGNPVPACTHEIYAWSDGVAGRIFGHLESNRFTAHILGKHL